MEEEETELEFPAVCIAEGLLYCGSEPEDIQWLHHVDGERMKLGDWVIVRQKGRTILDVRKSIEKLLPTEVEDGGRVVMDTKVTLSRPRSGSTICHAYSSVLEENIYIPKDADIVGFDFGKDHYMWITPMTASERDLYKSLTGETARWKLVVDHPVAPQPPRSSSVMKRVGIIVGQAKTNKNQYFVWTPGAPPEMEGTLYTKEKSEKYVIGDWIKFTINRDEGERIFTNQEDLRFHVQDRCKTAPLFDTKALPNMKTVQLLVTHFELNRESRWKKEGKKGYELMHGEIELIADPHELTRTYRNGTIVDLIIRRSRCVPDFRTPWFVQDVRKSKEASDECGSLEERNERPFGRSQRSTTSRDNGSVYSNGSRPPSRAEERSVVDEEPTYEAATKPPKLGDEYAFVTCQAGSGFFFLWLVDAKRMGTLSVSPHAHGYQLKAGDWIFGKFHFVKTEGRLMCTDWKLAQGPPDIKRKGTRTIDTKLYAKVAVQLTFRKGVGLEHSQLGTVKDPKKLVRLDANDHEVFMGIISTRPMDRNRYAFVLDELMEEATSSTVRRNVVQEERRRSFEMDRQPREDKKQEYDIRGEDRREEGRGESRMDNPRGSNRPVLEWERPSSRVESRHPGRNEESNGEYGGMDNSRQNYSRRNESRQEYGRREEYEQEGGRREQSGYGRREEERRRLEVDNGRNPSRTSSGIDTDTKDKLLDAFVELLQDSDVQSALRNVNAEKASAVERFFHGI